MMFDETPMGGGGGRADSARHLAAALDEEEQELWRQLRRKRDFEGRVAEKRSQLAEFRDRRREVSTAHAAARASVEQLESELSFAEDQRREIEHDIAVMKESNRILQQAYQQQQQQLGQQQQKPRVQVPGPMQGDMETHEILAEEKRRQESVLLQHEQIAHLRAHIEKLRAEKGNLQYRQQTLFAKQRSAEQDRNRLLGTLQDERSAINEVRQERIKLWEERTKMEQQMAEIVHTAGTGGGAGGGPDGVFSPPPTVPGASGGVRGHVTQDTPQAFADTTNMASPIGGAPRTGWTSGAAAGAGGGSAGGGAARPPPSFGDLAGAPRPPPSFEDAGGGITEWAGRVRDFRSGGGL